MRSRMRLKKSASREMVGGREEAKNLNHEDQTSLSHE